MDVETLHGRFMLVEATAVLRHDLRNKLAAVRNAAFYIQRKIERDAAELAERDKRLPTFFGMIRSELEAAEAIIADRVSRLDEPVTATFSVDEALAAAIAGTPATRHVAPDLLAAGAAGEVAVAVRCLIGNAFEAGAKTVTVGAARVGERVEITVVDDGPGVSDENVAREGHMGLGLRIVRRIAARAGGQLALAATEGGGTRAAFTLPGGVA
jgi:signal transduction histidine kinase